VTQWDANHWTTSELARQGTGEKGIAMIQVTENLTIELLPDQHGMRLHGRHEHETVFIPIHDVARLSDALRTVAATLVELETDKPGKETDVDGAL
jgi:hypothetical protein